MRNQAEVVTWTCRCHRWSWVGNSTGAVAYGWDPIEVEMVTRERIPLTATARTIHPVYEPGRVARLLDQLDRVLDDALTRLTSRTPS
jgi:hypothetical protein